MKSIYDKIKEDLLMAGLVMVAVMAIALATWAPPAQADSQGYPSTIWPITNAPATLAAAASSNGINCWFPVRGGRGASLTVLANTNTAVNGIAYVLRPSADGTNICTYPSWVWKPLGSSNSPSVSTTNWSRGTLDGWQWIVLVAITNNDSTSFTNGGGFWTVPNM